MSSETGNDVNVKNCIYSGVDSSTGPGKGLSWPSAFVRPHRFEAKNIKHVWGLTDPFLQGRPKPGSTQACNTAVKNPQPWGKYWCVINGCCLRSKHVFHIVYCVFLLSTDQHERWSICSVSATAAVSPSGQPGWQKLGMDVWRQNTRPFLGVVREQLAGKQRDECRRICGVSFLQMLLEAATLTFVLLNLIRMLTTALAIASLWGGPHYTVVPPNAHILLHGKEQQCFEWVQWWTFSCCQFVADTPCFRFNALKEGESGVLFGRELERALQYLAAPEETLMSEEKLQ